MAVYTQLTEVDIRTFLAGYELGELVSFKGITEGVSNTNYLITLSSPSPLRGEGGVGVSHALEASGENTPTLTLPPQGGGEVKYILTLFEKHFKIEELPYFVELMGWWDARGISCPKPIKMRDGRTLSALKERPALLVSYLEGQGVTRILPEHLVQLGGLAAQMHIAGMDFPHTRRNGLSVDAWESLIDAISERADEIAPGLKKLISEEYNYLSEHWPEGLPSGPIHADLFPDNVFFSSSPSSLEGEGGGGGGYQYGKLLKQPPHPNPPHRIQILGGRGKILSGVIDFYFSCNDFWAYDLAICVNAWCFDERHRFVPERVQALMQGYNDVRPLTSEEEASFPLLLRGAALRFLLTRAYDWLNPQAGADIVLKDPLEYVAKLTFFQEYGV